MFGNALSYSLFFKSTLGFQFQNFVIFIDLRWLVVFPTIGLTEACL
jgi:hypothetical protein